MSNNTANSSSDVKRPNKIKKYTPPDENSASDDPTADYMNLLGMVFSMFGLMMKMKWCAWMAVFCSFISFSNSRVNEDGKQMFSSFMLSISAVVMSYLQNPAPMTLPWQ
ncbi:PAT complex subunit Asterix-like [Lytechinus pictus]|uniref:PAT complex subunit Asterix-like n=1 Tax=Lytechinus pictus TaxID=7653 RepID=UPI00240E031A|nr:PAT complex subunit Asterix-like [Lytechinus pictus]XP_054764393.1 PAT complex subunit Asterix-like [Lytechinus pictus]